MNVAPTREGPRINEEIGVLRVRLVDERGNMVGVVGRNEALNMAATAGLDLVEIAPNADPPVCKILDYGKFKYEEQKKKNEARKKQKIIEVKEIKLRPSIDDHDYEVKMRSMNKFIEEGDKVKVTMRFRGRELAHQDTRHERPDPGPGRSRRDRQGRADAAHGRPPDDHGDGAQIGRRPPFRPFPGKYGKGERRRMVRVRNCDSFEGRFSRVPLPGCGGGIGLRGWARLGKRRFEYAPLWSSTFLRTQPALCFSVNVPDAFARTKLITRDVGEGQWPVTRTSAKSLTRRLAKGRQAPYPMPPGTGFPRPLSSRRFRSGLRRA